MTAGGGRDMPVGGVRGGLRAAERGDGEAAWEVACAGGEVARNGCSDSSCVRSATRLLVLEINIPE